MRILNFDDFLLEFESTKHFRNRSNINKNSEEEKVRYKEGSRLLPIRLTRVISGYSIKEMWGVKTLLYEDWLREMGVDRTSFESFLSQLWNYQSTHPALIERMKGNSGRYYAILPGPLKIKTGDFPWNPSFSAGTKSEICQQFMYLGESDSLITLYPVSLRISDEEIRRKIYGHNYREEKGNFRERFPNLKSFNLGTNLSIIKMAPEGITVRFNPSDPQNLEKAKAKIDEAYGSFQQPKEETI
jgi:hypothetical protein